MPTITGLSVTSTRLANTAFSATFFPRVMRSVWPRICGTTKSSASVEPFAFVGASPLLKLFQGNIPAQAVPSFTLNVPNPIWKNIELWRRSQFELDQTRVLSKRVGMLGVKVAQTWDYLLANVILNGSTAGSQQFLYPEDGNTYTMTFDNQPLFSASHTVTSFNAVGGGNAPTYSNIIQGHLPVGTTSLFAQDVGVTATQLQNDVQAIIQRISTFVDDKGALIYPDFDPARQLVLVVPPQLFAGAELAFRVQGGLIGGSYQSSAGSSTNIGYKMVKDVISWNLLTGCPNLTSISSTATLSPVNVNEYYAFIDGDFVRPFYFQRFMPVKQGETMPLGEDPAAQAARIIDQANTSGLSVTPEAAEVYAATEIDSNLGALGANAQESVVTREEFFVSARTRGMIFPGPWMTALKIDPTGTST